MDEYQEVISRLPPEFAARLEEVSTEVTEKVQEIRLRSGRPIILDCGSRDYILPGRELSHVELQECFLALTGYSLHSRERELSRGFFTLSGGHRVGVAGIPIYTGGRITAYKTFLSLNVRIARQVENSISSQLRDFLIQNERGLLVAGAPGSGKTTVLRAVARFLSERKKKVCVVDTRSEIFPGSDMGYRIFPPLHCDVMEGYERADGIRIALRTMGAEVILCDEIGTEDDASAALQGLCAGVRFVASVHGSRWEEVCRRPQIKALLETGAFGGCALLNGKQNPGMIREIIQW